MFLQRSYEFLLKLHLRFLSKFLQGFLLEDSFRCYSRNVSQFFFRVSSTDYFFWDFHRLLLIFLIEFSSRFISQIFSGFSTYLSAGFLTVILLRFFRDFPEIISRVLSGSPSENCPEIMAVPFDISIVALT